MKMPPFQTVSVLTAPNGKHYRISVFIVPCRPGCTDVGMHVHMSAEMLDTLPITYRGMVTWPTRRRRRRRADR